MTHSSLYCTASHTVPQADGMLSVLAGFSPRVPLDGGTVGTLGSSRATPRGSLGSTPRGQVTCDADFAPISYDPKLATKLMERRTREQERLGFIRTGLDIATLSSQIDAKRMAVEIERSEDKAYQQEIQMKAQLFDAVDAAVQDRRRQQHKDCVAFSFANLRKEQRREWSLSDPDQLKRDFPARREGHEVAFSSMQKFEGELRGEPAEIKEKKETMSKWLLAQMQEKRERIGAVDDLERRDDEAYMHSNELRHACELADLQERKEETIHTARENHELAAVRSARRQAAQARENTATVEHAAKEQEYNLMRERHDYDVGATGRKRDYKRCTYEEEQDMWNTNAALVQRKLDNKKADKQFDNEYMKVSKAVDIIGAATEQKAFDIHRQQRHALNSKNRELAEEQRQRALKEKSEYRAFAQSR